MASATEVNSYHCFGARESRPPLDVWAVADDGVVKAIRHTTRPILASCGTRSAIRRSRPDDIALFRSVFEAA